MRRPLVPEVDEGETEGTFYLVMGRLEIFWFRFLLNSVLTYIRINGRQMERRVFLLKFCHIQFFGSEVGKCH